ncbi:MAG: hypothetical protein ABI995_02725 [Acidobacteriota bacterium]
MIPPAALNPRGSRNDPETRAFPLGEPKMPTGISLLDIVRYLDVEHSLRYKPGAGKTYCNIYAVDYCNLAGAYLPRVWWNAAALAAIAAGKSVEPRYGETVLEVNANSLHEWLRKFGPEFGWWRLTRLSEVQDLANQGRVAVITGRRTDSKRPGHISCLIPESDEHKAQRNEAHELQLPLQSQAGVKNFCFGCGAGPWWTGAQFSDFGFWFNVTP